MADAPRSLFLALSRRLAVVVILTLSAAALVRLSMGRAALIDRATRAAGRSLNTPATGAPGVGSPGAWGMILDPTLPEQRAANPARAEAADRLAAAARLSPGTVITREWSAPGGPHERYVIAAIAAGDGVVRLSAEPVTGVRALTERIVIETSAVALFIFLGGAWCVRAAERSFRRDALRLTSAVSRAGRTGRVRGVPAVRVAELGRLARATERTLTALTEQVATLGAQRAQAKAILRSMPGSVIALDLNLRVMNTNRVAERLFGFDTESVRGRLLHEVVHQPALLAFAEASAGSEELRTDEFTLRGPSGQIIAASSRPLLDAEGELTGVVMVLQDVTRLRRLENMRRDFASNASHELRTPVTNILGYIETIEEFEDADAEQRASFMGIIRRNAERLTSIIEDMLELSRLDSPEISAARGFERTAIREVLDEVVSANRATAEKKPVTLVIDTGPDGDADLNPGLMVQALGNLVANAIRYSPEGTRVSLGCRRVGGETIEFYVEDRGPGIPDEHLPRLFERFYRVDPARSRELGGTGLGLAIAKHVALLHGGEIGVTSELGKGSRFWIRVTSRRAGSGGPTENPPAG